MAKGHKHAIKVRGPSVKPDVLLIAHFAVVASLVRYCMEFCIRAKVYYSTSVTVHWGGWPPFLTFLSSLWGGVKCSPILDPSPDLTGPMAALQVLNSPRDAPSATSMSFRTTPRIVSNKLRLSVAIMPCQASLKSLQYYHDDVQVQYWSTTTCYLLSIFATSTIPSQTS